MSYILEALKKADAERASGAVPDLHAQPMAPTAGYASETAGRGKPWLWLGGAVAVALLATFAWQISGRNAAPPAVIPAAPEPPPVAVQPAPAPAPLPVDVPASAPLPRATPAEAAPVNRKPAVAPVPAKTKPPVKPEVRSAPTAPPERVPLLADLPDELRRQVPSLALGGSVYSSQPASRMIIVNGLVLREGDKVAPELLLERIGPKSAVFSIRGQRFEVPL